MAERSLAEIGAMVARRRAELQMSQARLASLASISKRTLEFLETGMRWPRPPTQERIETALGWPHGSLAAARAGRGPLIPATTSAPNLSELDDATLWELIEAHSLDGVKHREALEMYEIRLVALLRDRLDGLSRRGLMATSRYIDILLQSDLAEGFRREANERPWSARGADEDGPAPSSDVPAG